MKRIFTWLETKLSRSESRYPAETSGEDDTVIREKVDQCIDPLAVDVDTSSGFNPYDTAKLYKK